MAFQVLVNFNEKNETPLHVANSFEEFEKTTVRELKEKFRSSVPGAPGPDHLRVFFGKDQLEDHRTLGIYDIKHLSVLVFVMTMPPAEAGQLDEDQQFLQSLLPALKQMDLKQRQLTKQKMQQLVYGADFKDPNSSSKGIRRTDSMEKLPPKM